MQVNRYLQVKSLTNVFAVSPLAAHHHATDRQEVVEQALQALSNCQALNAGRSLKECSTRTLTWRLRFGPETLVVKLDSGKVLFEQSVLPWDSHLLFLQSTIEGKKKAAEKKAKEAKAAKSCDILIGVVPTFFALEMVREYVESRIRVRLVQPVSTSAKSATLSNNRQLGLDPHLMVLPLF